MISSLEKIARGVYFHHSNLKRKLLGQLVVFPIFLGVDPSASSDVRQKFKRIAAHTIQDFKEFPIHGAFAEVFAYQVLESHRMVIVNMRFYGEKLVSVMQATE